MAVSDLAIQMVSYLRVIDRENIPAGGHIKPSRSPGHQCSAVGGEGGRRI